MTCTAEHRAAQAEERRAWALCEEARHIVAGKPIGDDAMPLKPLDEDAKEWAERALPSLKAAWRQAWAAANPRGEPGERPVRPAGRYRR